MLCCAWFNFFHPQANLNPYFSVSPEYSSNSESMKCTNVLSGGVILRRC
jgi:hypothetical protein